MSGLVCGLGTRLDLAQHAFIYLGAEYRDAVDDLHKVRDPQGAN